MKTNNYKDFIKNITPKINEYKLNKINEAQTKEWLIRPFFESLHWDFSNPDDVVPEDDDTNGKKPDYGFYFNKKTKFFVEAKSINTNIKNSKIINDKLNYCHSADVPFLIITNGIEYSIYARSKESSNTEKLLSEFSLMKYDEDIINLLLKESFANDLLSKYLQRLSVFANIKSALDNIFQSPPKNIIKLINNEIKNKLGHGYGDEDIKEFFNHINFDIDKSYLFEENNENIIEKETNSDMEKNWTVDNQFKDGKWSNSKNLYIKLIKYLQQNEILFTENPTKKYIGLIHNQKNYLQVQGLESRLKIFINIDFNELSEQEKIKATRDVSNIGHYGTGETECIIKNENDFEWVIGIIKKAFLKIN